MRIPLFDTASQVEELRPALDERMRDVIDSGRFVLGPELEGFEREFGDFLGVRHVIGVANGTDALTIGLRALGVRSGDDVVVPSFTFYATAEAVVNAGARPVFCDIDPETFCITAETVERALTPRTTAAIPVHLFGVPAPIGELRTLAHARGFKVLEDAAQAAGARLDGRRAGALGDAATFSFFPSKNLFCLGDGGALATDDDEVAEHARLLRLHGSRAKETFVAVGYNSRLDALQAAALRLGLPLLDQWNAARRRLADEYTRAGIAEIAEPQSFPDGAEPVHHLYVVCCQERDRLQRALEQVGIETRSFYRTPVHRQPAMAGFAAGLDLPATDRAANTNLALPMSPAHASDVAQAVVDALRQALNSSRC